MARSSYTVFDPFLRRHLDVFYLVLFKAAEETVLPELYRIFGDGATLKFLDTFAGLQVRVPTRKLLAHCVRDTMIYLDMTKLDGMPWERRKAALSSLCLRYRVSRKDLVRIWRRTRALVRRVGG